MLAYDSNIFYKASADCRHAQDPNKCMGYKVAASKALEAGKVHGCLIPNTVQREVRKHIIDEYAYFCDRQILDGNEKRFVEKFVDKLVAVAMKDEKFLVTCTSMGKDRLERIARARRGDWRIVAETLAEGKDITLVSFDHNIVDDYCVKVYKKVAEDVANKMKYKTGKWSAKRPELLEVVE